MSLAEIRSIGEDIVKLRSKNSIQNVPLEYLVRLLNLLDRHVQRAHEREVDENDDVSSLFTPMFECAEWIETIFTAVFIDT